MLRRWRARSPLQRAPCRRAGTPTRREAQTGADGRTFACTEQRRSSPTVTIGADRWTDWGDWHLGAADGRSILSARTHSREGHRLQIYPKARNEHTSLCWPCCRSIRSRAVRTRRRLGGGERARSRLTQTCLQPPADTATAATPEWRKPCPWRPVQVEDRVWRRRPGRFPRDQGGFTGPPSHPRGHHQARGPRAS